MIIKPQAKFWQQLPVEIVVSTKALGVPGRTPTTKNKTYLDARRKFWETIGLRANRPILALQVTRHTNGAVIENSQSGVVETNCAILPKGETVLVQYTADCIPLVIYDQKNEIIVFLHVGWKDFLRRVVPKALKTMSQRWGSQPENLFVYFGPSISKEYNKKGGWQGLVLVLAFLIYGKCKFSSFSKGCVHIDVIKGVCDDLREFGIVDGQIETTSYCTYRDSHLFPSHAREGKSREASIITAVFMKEK